MEQNFRAVRRVLWITLALNLVATAAKLVVGYWTDSLSLIAVGYDSFFDSTSNVIGLVGIYIAARPADGDHPYGHRKAETLSALVIAGLLFVTTWELIGSAVERLRDPSLIQLEVNAWSFGALLVSIVVSLSVTWYQLRAGRRLYSDLLVADALHTRGDVFVSLSVLGGLVAVHYGFPLADPILALVVALFIAKIGIDIIRETSPTLMDRAVMPPDEVERIALSVPGVLACHRVRSRGHEQEVYADLHIRVDPTISAAQAHAIAHEVQHRLEEYRPDIRDVTIHVEPDRKGREESTQAQIALQLRHLADGLGVGVHNVWVHELEGEYSVEAHLETDGTLSLQQAHGLASQLEERAYTEIPNIDQLITHIEPQGRSTTPVTGGLRENEIIELVREVVADDRRAGGCHQISARREAGGWAVSLHCHLPGEIPLEAAHRISAGLERRLRERLPDLERVTIHTEPQGQTSDSGSDRGR